MQRHAVMSDVPALFQRSRSHPLTPVLSSRDEACPTLEAGRKPLFPCSREHKASSNYLLEHSRSASWPIFFSFRSVADEMRSLSQKRSKYFGANSSTACTTVRHCSMTPLVVPFGTAIFSDNGFDGRLRLVVMTPPCLMTNRIVNPTVLFRHAA